jgi:hypothetical protein
VERDYYTLEELAKMIDRTYSGVYSMTKQGRKSKSGKMVVLETIKMPCGAVVKKEDWELFKLRLNE